MIVVWRILGYGDTRRYYRSLLELVVAEDEGMRSGALEKWCLSEEARSDEAKREADEFRLNLKLSSKAEGEFIQKLTSGGHRGRGGGR